MNDLAQIFSNKVLLASVTSWMLSQTLKVIISIIFTRRIDFRRFVGSGGMPSGHSASMMALSVSVGLNEGWSSALFAVTFSVALVIMYDAAGIRRAAGRQAVALNRIVEHLTAGTKEQRKKLVPEDLKELLGHTPLQVMAGAALGITIALLFGA